MYLGCKHDVDQRLQVIYPPPCYKHILLSLIYYYIINVFVVLGQLDLFSLLSFCQCVFSHSGAVVS